MKCGHFNLLRTLIRSSFDPVKLDQVKLDQVKLIRSSFDPVKLPPHRRKEDERERQGAAKPACRSEAAYRRRSPIPVLARPNLGFGCSPEAGPGDGCHLQFAGTDPLHCPGLKRPPREREQSQPSK